MHSAIAISEKGEIYMDLNGKDSRTMRGPMDKQMGESGPILSHDTRRLAQDAKSSVARSGA